jgi:hypothetical protein
MGCVPILFGINIANFKIVKLGVRVIRKGYEPIKKGRFIACTGNLDTDIDILKQV